MTGPHCKGKGEQERTGGPCLLYHPGYWNPGRGRSGAFYTVDDAPPESWPPAGWCPDPATEPQP